MKQPKLMLLIVVAVLALGLTWSLRDADPGVPSIEGESHAALSAATRESSPVAESARNPSSPLRSAAALPASSLQQKDAKTPRVEEAPALVSGRVLDTAGIPLAGVRLALRKRSNEVGASSAANGRFEFPLPKAALLRLAEEALELEVAAGQRWTSACGTPFTRARCTDLLLVAAPAIELAGVVVDESGTSIEGALIRLTVRSTNLRDFPLPLDQASQLDFSAASQADGGFHFAAVPALSGCTLRAEFQDSLRGEIDLPLNTTLDLRIVLRADKSEAIQALSGIVQSFEGQAVEGATVMYANASTKSAADGHFDLALPDWIPEGAPLVAVKKGFQSVIVNDVADRIARRDDSLLVLRLGPPTLEIRGRVLLSDSKPAEGWTVVLADGAEVSRGTLPPTIAESLAAGTARGTHSRSTNSAGEFTLGGLSARNYTVRAWNDKTLLALRAAGVTAGTQDLVLRVPLDATWPEIRGQVIDRRGAPIAKAEVGLQLVTFRSGGGESWQSSDAVNTAADGSFLLREVPRNEVRLSVSGDSVIAQSFELSELQLESELRLTVDLRCHFRLMCERTEGVPDQATLLDEGGTPLSVFTFQNGGWSSSTSISVHGGGATHAMAVSERARTLVLFLDDSEIARVPVSLLAGQVTDVRF